MDAKTERKRRQRYDVSYKIHPFIIFWALAVVILFVTAIGLIGAEIRAAVGGDLNNTSSYLERYK